MNKFNKKYEMSVTRTVMKNRYIYTRILNQWKEYSYVSFQLFVIETFIAWESFENVS
jgi:hypothetical protein